MEPQEYPKSHFQDMTGLVEAFRTLPAQVLEHWYSYEAFGAWSTVLRFKGIPLRLTFEGRDQEYVLERSDSKKTPYSWQLVFRRKADAMGDGWRDEVVEAVRGAVVAG